MRAVVAVVLRGARWACIHRSSRRTHSNNASVPALGALGAAGAPFSLDTTRRIPTRPRTGVRRAVTSLLSPDPQLTHSSRKAWRKAQRYVKHASFARVPRDAVASPSNRPNVGAAGGAILTSA
eukprot:4323916-Prymnesium_polylepis.1